VAAKELAAENREQRAENSGPFSPFAVLIVREERELICTGQGEKM
jgi:hypothetical protein